MSGKFIKNIPDHVYIVGSNDEEWKSGPYVKEQKGRVNRKFKLTEVIKSDKKRIYIDMDDTICDYRGHYKKMSELNPDIKYPQSQEGFFTSLRPIEDAVKSVQRLMGDFEVYILTRPSYMNPLCYTEKRIWIERHFGLEFCKNLIICSDKTLLKGDYLIDDVLWPGFEGEQLQFGVGHFTGWEKVVQYLYKVQE